MTEPTGVTSPAVARLQVVALDCPDPSALAAFYSAVLGAPIETTEDDWVQLAPAGGASPLAFQQVADYRTTAVAGRGGTRSSSTWTSRSPTSTPARRRSSRSGARKHEVQPGETFRVFLDPAGHPFCLVLA
jgi:catechol 2,3-dioxygenase-like lactoylglutathione lyase family enzyme